MMRKQMWQAGMAMMWAVGTIGAQTAPAPSVPLKNAAVAGTWTVTGDVQGFPVNLSCVLVQTDAALTGTCVDVNGKTQQIAGTVKGQTAAWAFNSNYEGTPITVTLTGVVDATGARMAGTIGVDPLGADGTFSAALQPAAPMATPTAAPSLQSIRLAIPR